MSRPIEFRAWDKKFNRMIKKIGIRKTGEANAMNMYVGNERTEPEDCILMQYTGLKDKNGTKVFEGDLCQAGSGIAKVIYDGFGVPCFVSGVNCLSTTEIAVRGVKFEVIGNIHETKN